MSPRNTKFVPRALLVCLAASLLMLAGCTDYLARRDTILASTGNSLAANSAIQTIDPWPQRSFARRQSLDGVRASQAMELYRTSPKSEQPPAPPSQTAKP